MEATFQPYTTPESLERPYGHGWRVTLRIKDLLKDDECIDELSSERLSEISDAIWKRMNKIRDQVGKYIDAWDIHYFDEIAEQFSWHCDTEYDFNERLNDLYNWADRCRVLVR